MTCLWMDSGRCSSRVRTRSIWNKQIGDVYVVYMNTRLHPTGSVLLLHCHRGREVGHLHLCYTLSSLPTNRQIKIGGGGGGGVEGR